MISIIMPTLNAAAGLKHSLPPLVAGVEAGIVRELIIADAGSTDATIAIADSVGATIVRSALGEGAQSIAGVIAARSDWFLFWHAEAALARGWADDVAPRLSAGGPQAFVFSIASGAPLRDGWANLRAGWLKTPLRTHGLLISRALYQSVGGYSAAPGAHKDLLQRIGGARIQVLRTKAEIARI